MSDISKCDGKDCDRKETCYRYIAKANPHWQSYIKPDPKNCEHYWLVCACGSRDLREKMNGFVCNVCNKFYHRAQHSEY